MTLLSSSIPNPGPRGTATYPSPLARRNGNRRRSAELGVAFHIVLGERFFEPPNIELLEQPGALQGSRDLKRQSGVDHDTSGISGRPAGGLYVRHVLGEVLAE